MIEQTQAQQTQAQAPKRPASSVPLLVGGAFFAGIAAFLGWGVWEATHPAPVPLQGMVDARTISVSAKVPGRLAELKVREGDVLGSATVTYAGEILGQTKLLAITDVARSEISSAAAGTGAYIQKNWWKWVVIAIFVAVGVILALIVLYQLRKRRYRRMRMEQRRRALEDRRRRFREGYDLPFDELERK